MNTPPPDAWLLIDLFLTMTRLMFSAIGGMSVILPEVYREVVDVHQWTTPTEFAAMVALAQAAPGPNGMFIALFGWRVAGVAGFFVAAAALCLPVSVLTLTISRLVRMHSHKRWLRVAQGGLVPVVVGLMFASGVVTARAADATPFRMVLTAVVALLAWRTRVNLLWLLGAGAAAGLLGL